MYFIFYLFYLEGYMLKIFGCMIKILGDLDSLEKIKRKKNRI